MGLCLALLPLQRPQQVVDVSVLCRDRLDFDEDYNIFGQLTDFGEGNKPTIKVSPIPPQMWVKTYEDEGIGSRRDDRYGTELPFVYAKELKKLKMSENASPKNKAIKAFLEALPDDTPIILLWW